MTDPLNTTDTITISFALGNETATAHLMADLAMLISPGDVITLSGDLGAGKTAAARAMIRYLAGDDELEVPSPTFTLVQTYDLPPLTLVHADLYRVNDPYELEEIGLSPLPDGAIALIEWPERAGDQLPADRIDISLSHRPAFGSSARAAVITGYGSAADVVERLRMLRSFLDGARAIDDTRIHMPGDASTRSYARLERDDKTTILMNSPQKSEGAALYNGRTYSAAVHLAVEVTPFVAIANGLRSRGISAPAIQHADLNAGFLITEDFGTESFVAGDPPEPMAARYEAATDMLAALHNADLPSTLPVAPGITYTIPTFDVEAQLIEVSLMLDWYLKDLGHEPDALQREAFFEIWRGLLARANEDARTWMIRDFHSPNLIWLDDREGIARVGVIDFQDTVLGPPAYDLVSLLQDARIDIPEEIEIGMLTRYTRARLTANRHFNPSHFVEMYALMSAQRNARLLGTFARLNLRDGKPQYLQHQPRIWAYLTRSLAHPSLTPLKTWFDAHVPPPKS